MGTLNHSLSLWILVLVQLLLLQSHLVRANYDSTARDLLDKSSKFFDCVFDGPAEHGFLDVADFVPIFACPPKARVSWDCLKEVKLRLDAYPDTAKLPCPVSDPIYYHTILVNSRSSVHVSMTKLLILSYLATQNQKCSHLIVWLCEFDHGATRLQDEFGDHSTVSFRLLVKETGISCPAERVPGFSDYARFAVLGMYGGIYTDIDFFFLHDMSPFWNIDFAYFWGRLPLLNTAVLGLRRGSPLAKLVTWQTQGSTDPKYYHPFRFTRIMQKRCGSSTIFNGFRAFPSVLFDPLWNIFDKVHEFVPGYSLNFTRFSGMLESPPPPDFTIQDFFPGSFGYHVHGQRKPILEGSYLDWFTRHFENVVRTRSEEN